MALRLNGSSSGYVELDVPAAAGSHTLTLPNSGGSSGQYLQTNGSGGLSWATVSSLSNAEDGAGTDFEFNSGYGSNATAYGVRAWVNFVGTGTVTKRQHGNITSVTDNATGDYTLSFTTALVDADYSVVASCGTSANGNPPGIVSLFRVNSTGNWVSPTTSAFRITTSSTGGIPQDGAWVCVAVIR